MDCAALKQAELRNYSSEQNRDWRKLPKAHGYWTRRFLAPKIQSVFECTGIREFFARGLLRGQSVERSISILSLGSGLCVREQEIATHAVAMGYREVRLECLEMSPERVQAANARFAADGVSHLISAIEQDINDWEPDRAYSGVVANQSLHHFVGLERLFDRVLACLEDDGHFVVSDMIGRNGHRRWPETLKHVQSIWSRLPEKYKYNAPFRRVDHEYDDWDYSQRSFEGVRSQDIMPLLNTRFVATHIVGEGGVIDPFIERKFGHNFDVDSVEDTRLLDQIGYLNETLIDVGEIKPTLLFAWFDKGGGDASGAKARQYRHWDQEFCTRYPS